MKQILVVCIGNICRSPMAECLLQQALGPDVSVRSAGLGALVNEPADKHARELMLSRGLSIEAHRAQQITARMTHEYELILVMTERQKVDLETHYPEAKGRVFRFCHWQKQDVADPYQQDRAAFEKALVLIEQGVADWARRLT